MLACDSDNFRFPNWTFLNMNNIRVQPNVSPWKCTKYVLAVPIQLSYCCKNFAVCLLWYCVLLETYQDHSSSIKVDRKTWPQDMMCSWQFRPTLSPHFVVYNYSISQNSNRWNSKGFIFCANTCLNHKNNTPSRPIKGLFWRVNNSENRISC